MNDDEIDRLVTGLAAATGVPLDPAYRPGVAANLMRLLAQGDIVMSVALPFDTEPAPIFRP
jgi:hypothetical protein